MCLVAPGQVIALDGATATVAVDGRTRAINTLFDPDIRVGDWVIVAAGTILRRVAPADADQIQAAVDLAYAEPAATP
jgi:hydrogenase assembly chaperone HypC/HupF